MTESLIAFAVLGFVLGIVYDFFRFFRFVFPNRRAVFVLDFFYFLLISPVIFLFLLSYNNGQVRVFYFTAILLGFLFYIITLFRITTHFLKPLAAFLRRIFKKCIKSFKKVLQSVKKVYYNVSVLRHNALHCNRKSKAKERDTDDSEFSEFD